MMQGSVTTRITTRILEGIPLRDALLAQMVPVVRELGRVVLAIVQVGDHGPSTSYIKSKVAACARVGIEARVVRVSDADGEAGLHGVLAGLACDGDVHAVIVQTPLPAGWNVQAALDAVPAAKDVDGLSQASMELRRAGDAAALLPATPLGILRLMAAGGVVVEGRRVAVIGQGLVVGAPLAEMLRAGGAEVVVIERETVGPERLAKACDVLVTATGVAGLVTEAWVKPGALVVDAGLAEALDDVMRVNGKLVGDVNRERVMGVAGMLTPVPGGVGPMTVASLLTNIVDAACLQVGRPRPVWVIDGTQAA